MFEQTDTIAHRVRLFLSGLAVIASLILLTLLITAAASISTEHTSQAQAGHHTKTVYNYDDANAISASFGAMAFQLGQTAGSVGQAANATVNTAAASMAQTSQTIGRGLYKGATFVTHGVVGSIVFVLRIPGNMLGFVAKASSVSAMIRPADKSQIPVIGPASAGQLTDTALPAAQSTVQASPNADPVAAWPIHGEITTLFGVPHWPYQPVHTGIDISDGRPSGTTPIKPFKPGRVIQVVHSYSGLGKYVIIDHGNGITSVYGHLASTAVQEGQNADKTTILGFEGSTGASTGTHLHFEIRLNGQAVDPRQYIAGQP